MYTKIPAISGEQLIKLLQKDGWEPGRKAKHGITLTKSSGNRTRVTFVPTTRASLPIGTLQAILSNKQTGLGKKGLLELLNKYGV
jgi:predicted RNA binding protein YcfA (HicA-like mRNA interferase family)